MSSKKSYILNLIFSITMIIAYLVFVVIKNKQFSGNEIGNIGLVVIWLISFIWGVKVYRLLQERKRSKGDYTEKRVRTYYYSSNPNNMIVYILLLIFMPLVKLAYKLIVISLLGLITTPFMVIIAIIKIIKG